jgi:hypothetical protein
MSSFTITHKDLSRLATIVGPSVGKDTLLPVFTYVQIRSHEGRVEMRATDRFTLAVARVETTYDGEPFCMRHADLKHLLTMLKMAGSVHLTISIEGDTITASAAQPDLRDGPSITVTFSVPAGDYPTFDPFLRDWSDTVARPAFNPAYLRRVPNLLSAEPVRFASQGEGKPCGLFAADWALVIMPIRTAEDATDQWLTKPEAEAA